MSRVGTGPASTADASSVLTGMLFLLPVSLVGNEVGALFRYPEIGSAVLFPPYAALTAVLVVSPARHWIWYLLGAVATHVIAHWPQWTLSFVLGDRRFGLRHVRTAWLRRPEEDG